MPNSKELNTVLTSVNIQNWTEHAAPSCFLRWAAHTHWCLLLRITRVMLHNTHLVPTPSTESASPGQEPIRTRGSCAHTLTVITALEYIPESHYVHRELLTCYDSGQSKNKLIFIRIQLLNIPIQWFHKTLHCLTSDVEKLQSFILKV